MYPSVGPLEIGVHTCDLAAGCAERNRESDKLSIAAHISGFSTRRLALYTGRRRFISHALQGLYCCWLSPFQCTLYSRDNCSIDASPVICADGLQGLLFIRLAAEKLNIFDAARECLEIWRILLREGERMGIFDSADFFFLIFSECSKKEYILHRERFCIPFEILPLDVESLKSLNYLVCGSTSIVTLLISNRENVASS